MKISDLHANQPRILKCLGWWDIICLAPAQEPFIYGNKLYMKKEENI